MVYGLFLLMIGYQKKPQHEKDLHGSVTLKGTNESASVWQIINNQAKHQINLEGLSSVIELIDEIKALA